MEDSIQSVGLEVPIHCRKMVAEAHAASSGDTEAQRQRAEETCRHYEEYHWAETGDSGGAIE